MLLISHIWFMIYHSTLLQVTYSEYFSRLHRSSSHRSPDIIIEPRTSCVRLREILGGWRMTMAISVNTSRLSSKFFWRDRIFTTPRTHLQLCLQPKEGACPSYDSYWKSSYHIDQHNNHFLRREKSRCVYLPAFDPYPVTQIYDPTTSVIAVK